MFVSHAEELDLATQRGSVRVEVFRRRDSNVTTAPRPVEGGEGIGAAATKCTAKFDQELALEVICTSVRSSHRCPNHIFFSMSLLLFYWSSTLFNLQTFVTSHQVTMFQDEEGTMQASPCFALHRLHTLKRINNIPDPPRPTQEKTVEFSVHHIETGMKMYKSTVRCSLPFPGDCAT